MQSSRSRILIMPRQLRIEYPGPIYHDLSRGTTVRPGKMALAARLRRETTLTIGQIAERLHMGSRKSLGPKLHAWRKSNE